MASTLTAELKALSLSLGFARVGVARVEPLSRDADAMRAWIAAGHHGQMQYMEETCEVRVDPTHPQMLPSVRSVIVLATSYARTDGVGGPYPGRVARYAQGRDYHAVIPKRVSKLARELRNRGFVARQSIDTMPVLERAWAQRAGLGFIGKNACLIIPGLGSHVLLSVVLTDAELEPDVPMRERCGDCRACLDQCPTKAFVQERQLDARRCISYLTIEHEGAIDESLRPDIGDWLFGCDVCQDVCPFNRAALPDAQVTLAFRRDARHVELGAEDFFALDTPTFDRLTGGSPLRRAGREGMARNAAIVLGNSKDKRYLPVLQRAAEQHDDDVVRETAAWAAQQLLRAVR